MADDISRIPPALGHRELHHRYHDAADATNAREQVIESIASGAKLTVSYKHVACNLRLNSDLFKKKWPRGTKKKKM